jgi:hypothetical protein
MNGIYNCKIWCHFLNIYPCLKSEPEPHLFTPLALQHVLLWPQCDCVSGFSRAQCHHENILKTSMCRYVGFCLPNQVGSDTITDFFFRYLFQQISRLLFRLIWSCTWSISRTLTVYNQSWMDHSIVLLHSPPWMTANCGQYHFCSVIIVYCSRMLSWSPWSCSHAVSGVVDCAVQSPSHSHTKRNFILG